MNDLVLFFKRRKAEICAAVLTVIIAFTALEVRRSISSQRELPKKPLSTVTPNATAAKPAAEDPWQWSYLGEVLRPYSDVTPQWSDTLNAYELHEGCDFAGLPNGEVRCVRNGRVIKIENDWLYGLSVTIEHNENEKSVYASLNSACVEKGIFVKAGEIVGTVGNSAHCESEMPVHVHFVYENSGKITFPEFIHGS